MRSAILRESIASRSNVDAEKGIITGCHLAEIGKLAVFADADGKRVELMVTEPLATGLLALLLDDNRLSAHWTHDWVLGKSDPLASRVATWRNFRIEDNTLMGDVFLWNTPFKQTILSAADLDKEGIMISMVFDYTGERDNPVAHSVSAADFVAKGAATTALCAAVLSAIQKTAKLDMPPNNTPPPDNNPPPQAAPPFTPEQEARINELIQSALNPPQIDDSTAPAMFAAINKAVDSRVAQSETKVANLAEAAFVKKIGGTAALKNFADITKGGDGATQFKTAVAAQITTSGCNRGEAIRRVLHDKPELAKYREAA